MIQLRCLELSSVKPGDYEALYARASAQRQSRADRYLRKEDKLRCVAADALIQLLPGYSREALAKTAAGKPYLTNQKLHFNVSHSGLWVVIAWGSSSVGIDVEQIQMDRGKEALARRYFSEDEQAYLFSGGEQERAERFFRIWTGKESYLKYLGTGIDRPLNSFSVLKAPVKEMLQTWRLPDACMTLCCEEQEVSCQRLTLQQLWTEIKDK